MTRQPSGRFSAVEVAREALLNLRASMTMATVAAAIAAVVGAGMSASTILDVDRVNEAWDAQVFAGRFVDVVRAIDPRGLPAEQCDALRSVTGVRTAGGVLSSARVDVEQSAGSPVDRMEVTAGFPSLAWPSLSPAADIAVIAGEDLVTRLGLVRGAHVRSAESDDQIVWAANSRSRIDGVGASILVTAAAAGRRMRECYVEYEPGADEAATAVVAAWFAPELQARAYDLLRPGSLLEDPRVSLQERGTRFGWVLAGGILGVLLLALWWARRSDFGLYRLLGLRPSGLALMLGMESVLLAALPFQTAVAMTAAILRIDHVATWDALARDDLRALCLLTVLPLIGLAMSVARSPLHFLKDR